MTSATIPGLDTAPTKHKGLLDWVQEVAELTQPERVVWADGSDEENTRLCEQREAAGTFHNSTTFQRPVSPDQPRRLPSSNAGSTRNRPLGRRARMSRSGKTCRSW